MSRVSRIVRGAEAAAFTSTDSQIPVVYSRDDVDQAKILFAEFERMDPNSRDLFCYLILTDRSCFAGKLFQAQGGFIEQFKKIGKSMESRINGLEAMLRKHRKPKRNAERDSMIMDLHRKRKTAGDIVLALASRWKLSDKIVNAVISRERRKTKAIATTQ